MILVYKITCIFKYDVGYCPQVVLDAGGLDKPSGNVSNVPSASARLAYGCIQLLEKHSVMADKQEAWVAQVNAALGEPEHSLAISADSQHSVVIHCPDILDVSSLRKKVKSTFEHLKRYGGAELVVMDAPYGIFPGDLYDDAPNKEALGALVDYICKEVRSLRIICARASSVVLWVFVTKLFLTSFLSPRFQFIEPFSCRLLFRKDIHSTKFVMTLTLI